MITINELTKEREYYFDLCRGVVYADENYIEFGYFERDESLPKTMYNDNWFPDLRNQENIIEVFSVNEGKTFKFTHYHPSIEAHKNIFGYGKFPYSIEREYEAEKHLEEFQDSVELSNSEKQPYSDELKYSFGIKYFIPKIKYGISGVIFEKMSYKLSMILFGIVKSRFKVIN